MNTKRFPCFSSLNPHNDWMRGRYSYYLPLIQKYTEFYKSYLNLTKSQIVRCRKIQNLNLVLSNIRAKVLHNFIKLHYLFFKNHNKLLLLGALLLRKYIQVKPHEIAIFVCQKWLTTGNFLLQPIILSFESDSNFI